MSADLSLSSSTPLTESSTQGFASLYRISSVLPDTSGLTRSLSSLSSSTRPCPPSQVAAAITSVRHLPLSNSAKAVDDVALPARFWHQFRDRCLEHVDGELRKAALLALKNSLSKSTKAEQLHFTNGILLKFDLECFRLQVSTYLAASLSHVKVPSVPDQTADQCFELVCDILCTLFAGTNKVNHPFSSADASQIRTRVRAYSTSRRISSSLN